MKYLGAQTLPAASSQLSESYWASVRNFGAVGNGSADDTSAFHAALSSGRPAVLLPNAPRATYLVSSTLQVGSDIQRIVGMHATLQYCGAAFGDTSRPTAVVEFVDTQPQTHGTVFMELFR